MYPDPSLQPSPVPGGTTPSFMLPAQAPKRGLGGKQLMLIGVGAVVLIGIAMMVVGANSGDKIKPNLQHIAAKYSALLDIVKQQRQYITSPDLINENAEVQTLATSDGVTIKKMVTTRYGEIPGDIAAAETDSSVATSLASARQLNNFDSTYRDLLEKKLDDIYQLIAAVQKDSHNSETLSAMSAASTNLKALYERLKALSF